MKVDIENFNAEGLLQEVIHLATKQAPYGSGAVLNYVIDNIFFPKEEIDESQALWDKIEKNVDAMVHTKVDDAVQRVLAETAASSTMKRLRNFGNLFRQLVFINNVSEKKIHLALLTNEANNLIADLGNLPPSVLLKAAKLLQVLAAAHIGAIMELKALEPGSYRHQSSLNNMAILYSDTAGSMYHRSMAWRRSLIAEGDGVIIERDISVESEFLKSDKKKVNFTVWDAFDRSIIVMMETPEIPVEGGKAEYHDTKMAVYEKIRVYDEKVQKEWTEKWNKALLNVTKSFMNLVDWDGRKRELAGDVPRLPTQLVFPVVPSRSQHHSMTALESIDIFLEQQMDQFNTSGPRYVQTYRPPAPGFPGDHNMIFHRADTYDTAMACIYFLVRGNLSRACDLGDGLVQSMNHDPIGEGRLVAATLAHRLIDPAQNFTTSIYVPDGGRRDIGNMSWTGIAFTRLFHQTKNHRYLNAAEVIGQWILTNCSKDDALMGFTGGEDHWGNKYEWRSVEHNVDCVSFFDNLFVLTKNPVWEAARESARTLVKACLINNMFYCTGTGTGKELNKTVVPTDCQSWVSLARVNPDTDKTSLMFMKDVMGTTSKGFTGTKFAQAGSEVQNEATAGAAMSLWFARHASSSFEKKALEWIDSLGKQITEASNSIGYGVVATPAEVADTGPGLGWKYFNYLHVASTAWTGLAMLSKETEEANPYMSLKNS